MRQSTREIVYVGTVLAMSLVLARFIWLLPVVFLWPAVVARTVDSPLVYLSVFALVAELLSTTPPGLMALIVILPWLVKRLLPGQLPDLSFKYFLGLFLVVCAQALLLFMPDLVTLARVAEMGQLEVVSAGIPVTIVPVIVFSSLLLFVVTVLVYFNT